MSSSSDEIGKLFFWKKSESVLSNMVNLTQIDVWLGDKWVDFFCWGADKYRNFQTDLNYELTIF